MKKEDKIDSEKLMTLHNEIRLAEKRNEQYLTPSIKKNLERYMGTYVPDFGQDWDIYLNEVYPIIQFWLPTIYYRNPKVFCRPKRKTTIVKKMDPDSGEMVDVQIDGMKAAATQEALLNYCLDDIGYKQEVRKCLFDALIAPHGVLWHGYKGEFGMTDEQSLYIESESVFVSRLCPSKFIFDPAVNISNIEEARWVGRIIDVPLRDIVDDPNLNVSDQIKGYLGYGDPVKQEYKDIKRGGMDKKTVSGTMTNLIDTTDDEFKKSSSARFVKCYEIFHRPSKKDKLAKKPGQIYFLTDQQKEPLRQNNWIYKFPDFPIEILGFNDLPDSVFGLTDISTYESIIDNKNIIRNIQIRNAQQSSKVWVALAKDGTNEEDIEKVKVGDQTIVMFDGESIMGKMQVSSPGAGASNELYLIDQRIDRELQDKSSVNDMKRGFLQSGEESAVSVKMRAAGGSVRPQFRQDIMADFIRGSVSKLNKFLKQFTPYKDAVRIMGTSDIEWSEVPTKDFINVETDIDIDVYSMAPANPEDEKANINMALNMMIQALGNPSVLQKMQQEGKTPNITPLIDQLLQRLKLFNPEIYRSIKPQESMGFVQVAEVKAAQDNIFTLLQGGQLPSPPAEGQDHKARLEVYTSVAQLMQMLGQDPNVLQGLIQAQAQFMQMEDEKKNPQPGQKAKTKVGV